MRRRLPLGVRMYTGDDFNYAELIDGDDAGHRMRYWGSSTPSRRPPRRRWQRWRNRTSRRSRNPRADRAASRHIFRAPTRYYKTGIVCMSWLNGHQDHFVMVGGAGKRPLACCIWPSCSAWRMRRDYCAIQSLPARA